MTNLKPSNINHPFFFNILQVHTM